MELVSRLMKAEKKLITQLNEEFEETKKTRQVTLIMTDEEWMEVPRSALKWKRLVTMLKVVMLHSETGSIISYLEGLRCRIAEEKRLEYAKAAGSSSDALLKLYPVVKQKKEDPSKPIPMAKGKALSRSIAVPEKPFIDPWMCSHPPEHLSLPRGGAGGRKWFTCLMCGSRWERVFESEATGTQEPPTRDVQTSSEPSGSSSQAQEPVPNPQVTKRKIVPYTIHIPTNEGTIAQIVDYDTMKKYEFMESVFLNLKATMSEKECLKVMMTQAERPEDISAVQTFITQRFQFVDAK